MCMNAAEMILEHRFADLLGWPYALRCGRGTTALWLALRAIRRRDGPGEVILPDILCATALEGVLLAGFVPVFADVLPDRYTLAPDSVAARITPRTRAILVAHTFGHAAEMDSIRRAAPGIPIIEDAVQGFGGACGDRPIGSLGDLSFISFDRHKMIGGRGGMLFCDDESLLPGIEADWRALPDHPALPLDGLDVLLPPPAAAAYADQLRTARAPALLRPFDPSPANLDRILADLDTLDSRVTARNANARCLHAALSALPDRPLALPAIRAGDAIWCYTLTAPSPLVAHRIIHDLHAAGLSASGLYPPLSRLFRQAHGAGGLADRLVNLWADEHTTAGTLQRTADVIAAVPWPHHARSS